ncbi:MAG: hypothetical protein OXC67_08595 [Flavobacteriaceae bacterium]|nr:hypothetical protein [Flavobacteriaceae bacterium]
MSKWSRGFQTIVKVYSTFPCQSRAIEWQIQEIKAIGQGDRKFENWRAAVLFFNGDLKLDP